MSLILFEVRRRNESSAGSRFSKRPPVTLPPGYRNWRLVSVAIARMAWAYIPSDENNKVFGQEQSFVSGAPMNVQFMVKDSKRFAETGGLGLRAIQ